MLKSSLCLAGSPDKPEYRSQRYQPGIVARITEKTLAPGTYLYRAIEAHDFADPHLQAVRPADLVRRRVVSAQSGRSGRPGRTERIGEDDALPSDHGRRSPGRR